MTQSAAKRRLQNYLVNRDGLTYKQADFCIASMSPKERGMLSQEAMKARQANNQTKGERHE